MKYIALAKVMSLGGIVMDKRKAKEIFERYNPVKDIVRCPYGRAATRTLLDCYALAALNLYGIISRKELVEIYNSQNEDQTNEKELYILLLPLILKKGWYCFYKDFLVNDYFSDDFSQADNLLTHQVNKPRYIPEKEIFLNYANADYEEGDNAYQLYRFLIDRFGHSAKTLNLFEGITEYIVYNLEVGYLMNVLEDSNLNYDSDTDFQTLINFIMHIKNNTRIWENNGHTPTELMKLIQKKQENVIPFPVAFDKQVGRNDPCPCGSGKKYKKCCALIDDIEDGYLSNDEVNLFYETWYGLMGFVNEKKKIIKEKIEPVYPNRVNDMRIVKIRERVWEEPELIDDYLNETELPQEKVELLRLWRTKHKKGMFLVWKYTPEHAVIIAPDKQGNDRLYGVKGISCTVGKLLKSELPMNIETVLLPFKGKIIYDGFISTLHIKFKEGAVNLFRTMYDKAEKNGIITSLE